MPTYEYECSFCKKNHDILQKITDPALAICPECEQPTLKRKISRGLGLCFQGSGFYSTDYAQEAAKPTEEKKEKCASGGCHCH